MTGIETEAALRGLYKEPAGRTVRKQMDRLDDHCRSFIAHSPFLVMATAAQGGTADASPRGGEPGFVRVLDAKTLILPDGVGNNRLDSLSNVLGNEGVGLLFFIPGVDETLRVNGRAEISSDPDLYMSFEQGGRRPATVLRITVEEAFLHCAKALMRAQLWEPEAWAKERPIPTMGQMMKDQTADDAPPESQEAMIARYRDVL